MAKVTKKELEDVLTRRLRLAEPEFRLEKSGSKISGSVISSTFRGKRDHERQDLIWDALEAEFGVESPRMVGMLLAYTPDEWNLGSESGKAKKAG